MEKTETVALGGSLAKLPVCQILTMSGVTMWPTLRTGRLVNRVALGSDAVEHQLPPSSLAPRAFRTIRACECCRAAGTPIVFWAGAVMALGAGGGGQRLGEGEAGCENQGGQEAAPLLCVHCDWSFLPRAFAAAPCIREARAGEKGGLALIPYLSAVD